jgi:hypothetical protein
VPLHVTSGGRFDERRNTSQLRPPAPDALPNALRALEALRRTEPELVAWVEAGAPLLSEDEHVRRFGEPWAPPAKRRGASR